MKDGGIIKWDEYVTALEKQIPKKVNVIFSLKTHKPICFKCPTCDSSVIGSGFYCWNYGQHLDWGTKMTCKNCKH